MNFIKKYLDKFTDDELGVEVDGYTELLMLVLRDKISDWWFWHRNDSVSYYLWLLKINIKIIYYRIYNPLIFKYYKIKYKELYEKQ